jgi:hypothetical protein
VEAFVGDVSEAQRVMEETARIPSRRGRFMGVVWILMEHHPVARVANATSLLRGRDPEE